MFDNPMIARGGTFYNGTTIDSNSLGGANLLGRVYTFEDEDTGNEPIICMVVRNKAGIDIKAKRLVTINAAYEITGYAAATADRCFPVDDQLSFDVPNNDLCLVVVRGPCLVKTVLEGDATNVIAVDDYLAAKTQAASTSTTAGRAAVLAFQSPTSAAAALTNYKWQRGVIGRALTAMTTAQTDSDVLVAVSIRF